MTVDAKSDFRAPRGAKLAARYVVEPTGCWHWTSTLDYHGYGRINFQGKWWLAHRLSYEHFVGPIPDGLCLDHLCRNPLCINPAHLEPVTMRENTMRGVGPAARFARATACGAGHPYVEGSYRVIFAKTSRIRICRACDAQRQKESKARRRAREQAA